MGYYLVLFLVLTYVFYLSLLISSFFIINHRINSILNHNALNPLLFNNYNVFSIIEGVKSFFALTILTLFPLLHFAGYFLVFAFLTEYTEVKILNIIIHEELRIFKKELEDYNIDKLFSKSNRYYILNHKLKVICNYFSNDNCYNDLFIFYQFIAFKNSLHTSYKAVEKTMSFEGNFINLHGEEVRKIEKDINFTFNLIEKYQVKYA